MHIAITIRKQMFASVPMPVIWSWGARNYRAIGENQIDIGDKDANFYYGGLLFLVSGMKFKGHVLITLEPSDTYTLTLGHLRKHKIIPKKQVKGIYFDELGTIIDELIEKQDNYAF